MTESDAIRSLAALAHNRRLQAFRALVVSGPTGLTPSSLSESVQVPPTALSFHLKGLLHAGLISQERQGRNLIYRANFLAVTALLGYLTENCCEGAACAASAEPSGAAECCAPSSTAS